MERDAGILRELVKLFFTDRERVRQGNIVPRQANRPHSRLEAALENLVAAPVSGFFRDADPARRRGDLPEETRCHRTAVRQAQLRSEEHTSELQSRANLVCRLLLDKRLLAS